MGRSKLEGKVEEILGLLEKGVSLTKIGQKYGCSECAVRHFLKSRSIAVRQYKTDKLYGGIENFLSEETPNKYYVLGALYGCYHKYSKKHPHFIFRSKHSELVEIVKKELALPYQIIKHPRRDSYFIQFTMPEKVLSKLEEIGLVDMQKRSFPNIKEKYLSHFIRGFIDAKGRLTKVNYKGERYPLLGISFNKTFLQGLCDALAQHAGIEKRKIKNDHTVFYGTTALKIRDFIYGNLENAYCLPSKKAFFYSFSYLPWQKRREELNTKMKEKVEIAQRLLEKGFKCKTVAKLLFDGNPHSFKYYFEKFTGVAPVAYRKYMNFSKIREKFLEENLEEKE
jgi:intein-encoded DNA endonuclease-like protein